ncbi:hypothetical protein Syun_009042 [Stephania yunnanensis]|uniref:NADH kinase n=1 Tax=Stephania yunnanensis TaxID=152371 RepID=A0AAP0KDR6_9MAGN
MKFMSNGVILTIVARFVLHRPPGFKPMKSCKNGVILTIVARSVLHRPPGFKPMKSCQNGVILTIVASKVTSICFHLDYFYGLEKVLTHMESRHKVHMDAVNFCQDILHRKSLDWEFLPRKSLSQPIRDVEMVITIGGDGTLLHASHFMDDSIPILGVNSDPTKVEEVEKFKDEFDARRSTGYLCAATVKNFEQVLDEILEGRKSPSTLTRILVSVNGQMLPHLALNDILVAHPCPAIARDDKSCSALVNCRSSGLRVCTAAGSTAAMSSAGGLPMSILSQDLQFMVREPIPHGTADSSLTHGLVKSDQSIQAIWYSKEGKIYIDGSQIFHSLQPGDAIGISPRAPVLKIFLPQHFCLDTSRM